MAENDHPPLTWHIALTTVFALTCYTVMNAYFVKKYLKQPAFCYIVTDTCSMPGFVSMFACGSFTTITRNCVHYLHQTGFVGIW